MGEFERLQSKLSAAHSFNTIDSATPHTVVVLPSYSVSESLLSHYANRLVALEHRFLVGILLLRMPAVRIVYVCSGEPDAAVVDHYLSLLPAEAAATARDRLRIVVVDDSGARSIAAKLLDRPDIIEEMRAWIGDQPAFIEPWNVTDLEVDLAVALGLPIFGTPPDLWPLGFKSSGKALLREAGVPVPPGFEHLTSVDEAVEAIDRLRIDDPALSAVVLKHDDSGAGDGNAVIRLDDLEPPGSAISRRRLRSRINTLEAWYLSDLQAGFIVEAMVAGDRFSSPSAQIDIEPSGTVRVLSTHEQVLDDTGQVYLGCRFPADPSYAGDLGPHARSVGEEFARRGALGRLAVDFVTSADDRGPWSPYALEINLRRGGTTHSFVVLRHLAPGSYDADAGIYVDDRGDTKCYAASDNLVDERWTGLPERSVVEAMRSSGLLFDRDTRTGVVPHMLSCLAVDGRFGVTAIGNTAEQAEALYEATRAALDRVT